MVKLSIFYVSNIRTHTQQINPLRHMYIKTPIHAPNIYYLVFIIFNYFIQCSDLYTIKLSLCDVIIYSILFALLRNKYLENLEIHMLINILRKT